MISCRVLILAVLLAGAVGQVAAQCDAGFTGLQCEQCMPNHYGDDCTPCACSAEQRCDSGRSGVGCWCNIEGWDGPTCDYCQAGRYGTNCEHTCPTCVHGACSDGVDGSGTCACTSDWSGELCDECVGVVDSETTCLRGVVARYVVTLEATESTVIDTAKRREFRDVLLAVIGLQEYPAAVVVHPPAGTGSSSSLVTLEVDVLEQDGFQHVQTWLEGLEPPRTFLDPFVVEDASVRVADGSTVEITLQRESTTSFTDHAYAGVVIAIALCFVLIVLNTVIDMHDEKCERHPLRGRYRTNEEKCECECDLYCGSCYYHMRNMARVVQRQWLKVRSSRPCVAVLGKPRPRSDWD